MIARSSRAFLSVAAKSRRGARFFGGLQAPEKNHLPEMKFRHGRNVVDEVKSQMTEYSNISQNILDLVDRRLYKEEGHPLCTLADL